MAHLTTLSSLSRDRNYDFRNDGLFDPTGATAYAGGQRIGTVRDALVDPNDARLRYLIVDLNGDYGDRGVIVPIGYARIDGDDFHFDNLSRDQIHNLHHYRENEVYTYDAQVSDERTLRGADYNGNIGYDDTISDETTMTTGTATTGMGMGGTGVDTERRYNYRDNDTNDTMYKTPDRLQLLEERLRVDKERYVAGSVEIGKHVETTQQQVNVPISHEEVVIERHAVTDTRPVGTDVTLGASNETIRVDLEAERANVRKEAYVTEEVSIGERTVTETQTVTETVGREVLDVNRTGDVNIGGDAGMTGNVRGDNDRSLTDRAADAIDNLDGRNDRNR